MRQTFSFHKKAAQPYRSALQQQNHARLCRRIGRRLRDTHTAKANPAAVHIPWFYTHILKEKAALPKGSAVLLRSRNFSYPAYPYEICPANATEIKSELKFPAPFSQSLPADAETGAARAGTGLPAPLLNFAVHGRKNRWLAAKDHFRLASNAACS